MKHVVMFSSGAGSWAAARRVADEHGTQNLSLVFSDVLGEDEDNYRFLIEASAEVFGVTLPKWWNSPWRSGQTSLDRAADHLPGLVWLKDGRTIWDVFKQDRFLGNSRLANCSKFLKQIPARRWLEENCDPTDTTVYVGIDWMETHRLPVIEKNYLPWIVKAPMTDAPYSDKAEILADLRARGVEPPRLYGMGFAHANCGGGCVRSGQGQFAKLLEVMPERYAEWERNEQEVRDVLGKDVAILRDRSGGKSTPLTLRAFRERHETKPQETDRLDLGGCGCFVDEGADDSVA